MKKLLLAVIIFISGCISSYATCAQITVQINGGVSPINICENSPLTLYGNVTVDSPSMNGGFTYSWIKDNVVLQTATINITPSVATTVPSYTGITGQSSDAGDYILRVEDGNSGNAVCYKEATVSILISQPTTPGVIGTSQTICTGGDPAAFTVTTAAGGGNATFAYIWESDIATTGTYAAIAGATNATYDEGVLTNAGSTTKVIHYRRKVTSGACPQVTSNVISITVNPVVVAGVITADQTICSGGDPAAFTQTTAATGGSGTYTYQWQSATIPTTNFTNISGATSATYDAPAGLTTTRYYRRVDGSGTCATANTNAITVTVSPSVTPSVTISTPNTTICAGTSVTLTATPTNGGTMPPYQWRKNGVNIAGATNSTYTTISVSNGDSYSVVMTSNASCTSPATATSNAIVLTVTTVVTPVVTIAVSPDATICTGTSITFTATPGNGGTAPTYQWFKGPVGIGTALGIASPNNTYTTTTAANNDSYYVIMTSNSICVAAPGKATSNAIVITVASTFTPSVSIVADKSTICSGQTVVFTATPVQGGLMPPYVWKNNGVAIPGQTNSSLSISTLSTPNSITAEMVSTAVCAPTTPVTSNTIVITVHAGIGAGTIGSDQTICYNTIPATLTQLTAASGITTSATYTWEVSLDGISGWSTIPGATNTSYTPLVAITSDMFVRRIVLDATLPAPCNIATSNTIHITVRPQLTAGIIGSDETLCAGSAFATITEISAPTGGMGTYTYQWESSTQSGGPYVNIPTATTASYNPGSLTTSTYFRRIETSGTCGSVTSNVVAKEISAASPTLHLDDPGQLCVGDIYLLKFQATNMGSSPIYNWYVNNSILFSTDPAFTHVTPIEPLKTGDELYVELISANACATSASSIVSNTLTVDLTPCTASTSPYTSNNVPILMQTYVANSVPNVIDYMYFWSVTTPFVISGPNTITAGQQNTVYSVPDQAGLTYQWSVTGGTIVSGQNTSSVTVDWDNTITSPTARTTSAAYSISVTKTNQSNESRTTNLDITATISGTTQSLAQSGINVFPNPTSGTFNITMPESGLDVTYEILDLTGVSVASGIFTSTGGDQKIDADFAAGMYQVVLKYNDVVTCARLSKIQ